MSTPTVVVAGVGHTRFGRLADKSLQDLVVAVTKDALRDAGISAYEVDEVFIAHYNAGMQDLAFISSLPILAAPELWGKPSTRVENACASGAAALHQGIRSILAGTASTVLVIGVEKMTDVASERVGAALLGASYEAAGSGSQSGFASVFADVAQAYADRYGDPRRAMALIAAKNHWNGLFNPWAHLRKEYSFEDCFEVSDSNPLVAPPLRRTDCAPVSDGAAALVLQAEGTTAGAPLAKVIGFGHSNDHLPLASRDILAFAGARAAVEDSLAMAEISIRDIDFAELHDCFTIAELILYEVLGLADPGEGVKVLEERLVYKDGRFPVNPSGGLKAKGHPVGATGVSQVVMACLQLCGRAGDTQLTRADTALAQNMGGLGVANYATILRSP